MTTAQIIIAIIAGSLAYLTILAMRAPLGFQTDRGFFYGVPDEQEAQAQHATERLCFDHSEPFCVLCEGADLGIGGGADRHAHLNRTEMEGNHG